ncbi:hypothetical protein MASR2M47_21130 [Draconibacterium sp.]
MPYDKEKAGNAMDMFRNFMPLKQKAREENFSAEQRYGLRLEQSLPLLNELSKWMVETYKSSLQNRLSAKQLHIAYHGGTTLSVICTTVL